MRSRFHYIPKEIRDAVWLRDEGCCVICGRSLDPERWQCHHRRYLSRGGKDELANFIALDARCHLVAVHEDYTGLATANGWAVSRTRDPAEIPVRYADGSLRTLTNEAEKAA